MSKPSSARTATESAIPLSSDVRNETAGLALANILSLDAPLIAVAWQILFLRCFGVPLRATTPIVLAACVWLVYVADRILDGWRREDPRDQTPRHRFYEIHALELIPALILVSVGTIWLSLTRLNPAVFRGYCAITAAVVVDLLVVHLTPETVRHQWPKELIVAALFAAGSCVAVWVTAKPLSLIRATLPFLLFAAALSVNALAIECWERVSELVERTTMEPWITRQLALHLGSAAAVIGALAALLSATGWVAPRARPIYAATAISAFALAALEWRRKRISTDALRVLADVVFLSPLLLLPFLR